jgi:acylphosphatase
VNTAFYAARRGRGIGAGIAAAFLACGSVVAQTNQAAQVSTNAPPVPDKTLKRAHAFVSGRVQGVGFRAFTSGRVEALSLRVTGWVRNLADGRVELVAEGLAADVARLLAEVAKGPPASRVDAVEQKEEPYTGEFKSFRIAQ